jgi:hypothetical protein
MLAIMQLPDRNGDIDRLGTMLPEVLQSFAAMRRPTETGGKPAEAETAEEQSDAWC